MSITTRIALAYIILMVVLSAILVAAALVELTLWVVA